MTANKQTMQPHRILLPIMAGLFVLSWGLVFRQPLFALPLIAVSSALLAWLLVQKDLEPAFMKIVAFLLPFSTPLPFLQESMLRIPTEPMIGLAILMLPLYLLKAQRRGSNPAWKEAVIVLPLFGAYLLSTLFSEMPVVSIKFTFVNIAYILVFYILLLHLYRQHNNLFADMIKLYGIGFLLVFLWSLYQYHSYDWNPVVVRGIFRPFYNDHTIFGASAAMLAVLATGTGMRRKSLPGLITGGGAMFLFMIAVLYSTSRGAMLSLFFAGLVAVVMALRPRPLLLGGGLVLLLLTGLVFYPGIRDRIQDTSVVSYYHDADHRDPGSPGVDDSIDVSSVERVNRWISAWRMFRERPLTGFGPGTYQFTYIPYQEERLTTRLTVTDPQNPPEGSGGTAHSEYFLLLRETGIPGLLAFLLIIGRWSWLATRPWRNHPKRKDMAVALVALSTYFFHALVNNFLTTDKFAFLFWGTAAWLLASYYQDGRMDNQEDHTKETEPWPGNTIASKKKTGQCN